MAQLHTQYITDNTGQRVSVVIPLAEFEELLEDLNDLATAAERRNEPTITHNELLTGLQRDGII